MSTANTRGLSASAQWVLDELRDKSVLTGCTSYIQRRMQIGYVKAAGLIDELVDGGFLSEPDDTGQRKWIPVHCQACGTLSYSGRCDCTKAGIRKAPNGPYVDR